MKTHSEVIDEKIKSDEVFTLLESYIIEALYLLSISNIEPLLIEKLTALINNRTHTQTVEDLQSIIEPYDDIYVKVFTEDRHEADAIRDDDTREGVYDIIIELLSSKLTTKQGIDFSLAPVSPTELMDLIKKLKSTQSITTLPNELYLLLAKYNKLWFN